MAAVQQLIPSDLQEASDWHHTAKHRAAPQCLGGTAGYQSCEATVIEVDVEDSLPLRHTVGETTTQTEE